MKTGLYIGRFQPLHLGHISAIKQALKHVDFLYIGIGSSQYSNEEFNPFSANERTEIIKRALDENNIAQNRYKITLIPDIHNNKKWPAHVHSLVGDFDIVFTCNDGIVKKLFEKYGINTVHIVNKEINISATEIRKAIINNGNWKKYVVKSTANYLKEINGIERVKNT